MPLLTCWAFHRFAFIEVLLNRFDWLLHELSRLSHLIVAPLVHIASWHGPLNGRDDLCCVHVECNWAWAHRILFLQLSELIISLSVCKVFTISSYCSPVEASQIHACGSCTSSLSTSSLRHWQSSGVLNSIFRKSFSICLTLVLLFTSDTFLLHSKSPYCVLQDRKTGTLDFV